MSALHYIMYKLYAAILLLVFPTGSEIRLNTSKIIVLSVGVVVYCGIEKLCLFVVSAVFGTAQTNVGPSQHYTTAVPPEHACATTLYIFLLHRHTNPRIAVSALSSKPLL